MSIATLVCGPPCSGKTTYVQKMRSPGDLVIDFDAIILALGGAHNHDHPDALKRYAFEARDHVLSEYNKRRDTNAWVIHTAPLRNDRERMRKLGYRVVLLDTPRDVCLKRAREERPAEWVGYVSRWFERFQPDDQATSPIKASRQW